MRYFLILFCLSGHLAIAQDTVSYQTLSIFNKKYLASHNWTGIPVDEKSGEDINTKRYGSIYYPLKARESNQLEQRLTVPSQYMEIEIELPIVDSEEYELQYLTAEILNIYDVSAAKYDRGSWLIGSRSSEYLPYIELSGEDMIITEPVEDVILGGNYTKTIICEISIDPGDFSDNKLFEFGLMLSLISLQNPDHEVTFVSDKQYFISGK